MHIYWHNLSLKLSPETEAERLALALLAENTKFGKPPEFRGQGLSEQFLHLGIVDHQVMPRGGSAQSGDQDAVVSVEPAIAPNRVA